MQDQASTRLSPPNRLRRQRGYSVVELSIALSIIAILTVAGLAGVQTVLNTNKSNNQIEQSGQSITKLSSTFQGQTSTANATNAVGVGLGRLDVGWPVFIVYLCLAALGWACPGSIGQIPPLQFVP